MLDSSRRTSRMAPLGWSLVSFGLFVLLMLGAQQAWPPITEVDSLGRGAAEFTREHPTLRALWLFVEVLFGLWGILAMTALLVLLVGRKHRRPALFALVVVLLAIAARRVLVVLIGRERPEWQLEVAFHTSPSFPSGHAGTSTVLAGVCAVLVAMLVRRRSLRRWLYAGLVLVVVLNCLDRIFLGRHYPSDTVAGVLFGVGVVALALAVHDPQPRSHAIKAAPLLELQPRGHRLAVVLNPIKVDSVEQFQEIVTTMAREAGWDDPDWFFTTVEDPGTGMARAAEAAGADLVLVCGGDGTVREVCAALAGTGIAVGIIPAGTGNLLARNLSIPLYLRAAIDVALTGQDRAIDLVEVSGDDLEDTSFMVMAGMGFDAAIMDGVNEDIKKRIGWLAYVLSGMKALMFPPVRLEISVDGGEYTRHRARTVVVGNVGTLTAGMPLLPDAAIDDGLLDVVMLHPQRFLSWLPLAWRILTKRPATDDLVNRMTGRTVHIRASQDTPRQLDGDPVGAGRELRMTCIHGRLLVRVPRG